MSAPTVRGPADLPDFRLWLRDQWRDEGVFTRAFAKGVWNDAWPSYSGWERKTIDAATLWYVSADMVDLLAAAVVGVPDEVLFAELPKPAHAALVVFEKSISGIDANTGARTCEFDAILWGGANLPPRARPGATEGISCVSVSSYRRLDFDAGLSASELQLAVETGATKHARTEKIQEQHDGKNLDEIDEYVDDLADRDMKSIGFSGIDESRRVVTTLRMFGESWAPLGRSDWPLDEPLGDWSIWSPSTGTYSETMKASAHEDRRLLAALWTLLAQSAITRTTTKVAERQTRRRSERAGVKTSDVVIVTLRRPERSEPVDGDPVERRHYSHTFLVSGHWRHQPVGPGRSERRLTWVRPHTKGDGPFLGKTRVNAWVR